MKPMIIGITLLLVSMAIPFLVYHLAPLCADLLERIL